ncbi:C6 zinc finger domain protein [Aspergillus heteromorphus CBS 117.55]|uniref:C6 zinc finger domain protein n=1 Tax=Aspergillus heteromorphus CBS 117.55 TaxID=1448321 RepID=A0A317W289_9EURO|nr:C6 zinc finger domain protein [Aspergillus heteromorphus CBS 117.55]PWY79711.1 C6 zinc finger domain protein [Aspergillus heteromorphus CBS 117.55]
MEAPLKKRRASKPKGKTGCRTCKVRRVKCDEGRPACTRCVSTGRVCDGYGIWGGGGNAFGSRIPRAEAQQTALVTYSTPVPMDYVTADEGSYVEWFIQHAIFKIGGMFPSEFWNKLVIQALFQESAVRHAVLALSSAHRYGAQHHDEYPLKSDRPSENERFTLRHYNRAIGCLKTEFGRETGQLQSKMVALITCMLFVTLEMLRGQYKTSHTHLQHGVMLLREIKAQRDTSRNGDLIKAMPQTAADDIMQVFGRLAIQSALFGQRIRYLNPGDIEPDDLPNRFQSVAQARRYLDVLLARTQSLVEMCRQIEIGTAMLHSYDQLLELQGCLEEELDLWLVVYNSSLDTLLPRGFSQALLALKMLKIYHTMALIMVVTCVPWNDQVAFDLQTERFILIINDIICAWQAVKAAYPKLASGSLGTAFTMDMGFIPPLYYTALKCRVPRIRRQAIRLLRMAPHREGVWSSSLTSRIAEEVIAVEERKVDATLRSEDSFDALSVPEESELEMKLLPHLSRISDVRVNLPDEPTGNVTLSLWQIQDGNCCKVHEKVFAMGEQAVPGTRCVP